MTLWNRFRLWSLKREVAHWEHTHRHLLRQRDWLRRAITDAERSLIDAQNQLRRLA